MRKLRPFSPSCPLPPSSSFFPRSVFKWSKHSMLDSTTAKIYFNFRVSKQEETNKTFDISNYASQVNNERQTMQASLSKLKLQVVYRELKSTFQWTCSYIVKSIIYTETKSHVLPNQKGTLNKSHITSEKKLLFVSSGIICAFNFTKHTANNFTLARQSS